MATFLGLNLALQVVGSRCCTKSPTLQDIFSINIPCFIGCMVDDWQTGISCMHTTQSGGWPYLEVCT